MIWIDQQIVLCANNDARHDQNAAPEVAKPLSAELASVGAGSVIPIWYLIACHHFIGRALGDRYFDTVLTGRKNSVEMNELLKHGEAEMLGRVDWILAFLVPAAFGQLRAFAAEYRVPAFAVTNSVNRFLRRQFPVSH